MNSSNLLYGKRSRGGQHGDVFTLPAIVQYMLDTAGYTSDKDLRHTRILEPSCGEGEFVIEIAHRLTDSAKKFGFDANDAFAKNVRAYDIDGEKVATCCARLRELGIESFEKSVIVEDFLSSRVDDTNIVIGNPPYIRYENIPQSMREYCKKTFTTFHYRCDLYVPFFEKSLSALTPGGVHCFICSNRWLKNEYGKKLRLLLANNYRLNKIVNLERANAFQEEVLAYPAITLISHENPSQTFKYAECSNIEDIRELKGQERAMPQGSDWSSAFNEYSDNNSFQTIEQQGFKIGIGVATGADSIFISKDLPNEVEPDLIMPSINARDLRGNKFQWQGEYLLNPYNADGSLVNLKDFPRASAYLERYKEKLSGRHIAKKSPSRWYKTIDRITPILLTQPKILLPDMSGNTYIFVDDGQFYPLHNIYYIVGRSSLQLRLLAAFLMSDFVRNQLSAVTNKMNGGFSRWQSQHLRKLLLPNISSIPDNSVQLILSLYDRGEISSLNKVINSYVAV